MPGFVDTDPTSPVVYYETADGRRIPLPRAVGGAGVPSRLAPPPEVDIADAATRDDGDAVEPDADADDATASQAQDLASAGSWVGGQFVPGLQTPLAPPTIDMPAEDVPRGPAAGSPVASVTEEQRGGPAMPGVVGRPSPVSPVASVTQETPAQRDAAVARARASGSPIASVEQEQRGTPIGGPDAVTGAGAAAPTSPLAQQQVQAQADADAATVANPDYDEEGYLTPDAALFAHAKIKQEQADAELAAAQAAAQQRALLDQQNQRQQAVDAAKARAGTQDYLASIDKAAKAKIDPNRWWHDLGTGRRIGTIMMALVSGFGSVLKHQGDKNPALDLIMGEIQRDVSLQMDQRDQLTADVGRRRDALDVIRQQAQDRQGDYQGRVAALAQRQADQFDVIARQAQDEDVAYQYADMANQLRAAGKAAAAAGAEAEFKRRIDIINAEKTQAETRKLDAETAKLQGGGSGVGTAVGDPLAGLTPKQRELAVVIPDWQGGKPQIRYARAASDVPAIQAEVQASDRLIRSIDDVAERYKKASLLDAAGNRVGLTDDDVAAVSSDMAFLTTQAAKVFGDKGGKVNDSLADLVSAMGADPKAAVSDQNTISRLTEFRRNVISSVGDDLAIIGGTYERGAMPAKSTPKSIDTAMNEVTGAPPPSTKTLNVRKSDGSIGTEDVPSYETPSPDAINVIDQQLQSVGDPDVALGKYNELLGSFYDNRDKLRDVYKDATAKADAARKKKDKAKAEQYDKQARGALAAADDYDTLAYKVKQRIADATKRKQDAAKKADAAQAAAQDLQQAQQQNTDANAYKD